MLAQVVTAAQRKQMLFEFKSKVDSDLLCTVSEAAIKMMHVNSVTSL
jgi:hypothetical protein